MHVRDHEIEGTGVDFFFINSTPALPDTADRVPPQAAAISDTAFNRLPIARCASFRS